MRVHSPSANIRKDDSDDQAFFIGARFMAGSSRLLFGVGINDSTYSTRHAVNVNGSQKTLWECQFYAKWKSMLERCYSARWLEIHPSYVGTSVCDEWLRFSVFKSWMELQEYVGMDLEKDLIKPGNRVYGPENCIFITESINAFITESKSIKGEWPTGVHYDSRKKKFIAQVNDPFSCRRKHLGNFSCPNTAHKAWRLAKHSFACRYADMQTDPRIAEALRTRYLPDKEII